MTPSGLSISTLSPFVSFVAIPLTSLSRFWSTKDLVTKVKPEMAKLLENVFRIACGIAIRGGHRVELVAVAQEAEVADPLVIGDRQQRVADQNQRQLAGQPGRGQRAEQSQDYDRAVASGRRPWVEDAALFRSVAEGETGDVIVSTSGGIEGLAKAGNARVRRGLIQLAWRFLMFQKDSALARWYRTRTEGPSGARKTTMIVALARKLLIALWRLVTTGEVPDGVELRPAA